MATAGERYEERTGNIWSYAHRGDLTGLKAALIRGVDANTINTVGWTPSHAAAAGGQSNALRLLAKADADLTLADKGGNLPVHQAAKNGHVHALEVLQELGADVTEVRLSHGKGKAVRDFLKEAYRRADVVCGRKDGDEEEPVVGYARKQSKSTAFWGPRRTPISGKIKKKILKDRRKLRRDKNWSIENNIEKPALVEDEDELLNIDTNDEIGNEPSYLETVQQIKRSKKQKKRGKQGRKNRRQLEEIKCPREVDHKTQHNDDNDLENLEENANNVEHNTTVLSSTCGRFAALSLSEDSDSE